MTNELSERHALIRDALVLADEDAVAAIRMLEQDLATTNSASDRAAIAKHAAVICHATGNLERAVWFYGQSLASDPNDAYAHLAVGQIYRELGQPDEARRAFSACLAIVEKSDEPELLEVAKGEIARLGS